MRPDETKSKDVWTYIDIHESKVICCYIDLNFSVCKIIEFTLKSLKEMLEALGLSQVVTKWKSLEDLMSPNTTEDISQKNFF